MKNLTSSKFYKYDLSLTLDNQNKANKKYFPFVEQILDYLQLKNYLVSKRNSTNKNFAIYTINSEKNKNWIAKFEILSRTKKIC